MCRLLTVLNCMTRIPAHIVPCKDERYQAPCTTLATPKLESDALSTDKARNGSFMLPSAFKLVCLQRRQAEEQDPDSSAAYTLRDASVRSRRADAARARSHIKSCQTRIVSSAGLVMPSRCARGGLTSSFGSEHWSVSTRQRCTCRTSELGGVWRRPPFWHARNCTSHVTTQEHPPWTGSTIA